ncbi:YqgE/AlgH family protein [Roseovarius spongiae]|uniref:UPF0301 protein D6850_01560 n=2 Tax=Roseovarius spongiae TaxID=2320272 RepID=A0A3A8B0V1_9RHOB|nr:YqgE/AlgH family protein [Roseovarius spongiae]
MNLTGQTLIAMPGMGDDRFGNAVVFMCAHSPEGAMGLIVNKPTSDLSLSHLLDQLSVEVSAEAREMPVHFGGPVEHGRGFVLHEKGYASPVSTLDVSDAFAMTAAIDILEDMAGGGGPEHAIIALGYAGWGPGQLESEIARNGWLICPGTPDLIFDTADPDKWEAALTLLGVSPLTLSAEAGRA